MGEYILALHNWYVQDKDGFYFQDLGSRVGVATTTTIANAI